MGKIQEVYFNATICVRTVVERVESFIRESKEDFAAKHDVKDTDVYIVSINLTDRRTAEGDYICTLVLETVKGE